MSFVKSGIVSLGVGSFLLTFADLKATDHSDKGKFRRPNVIFILADDLGYGDLSCYGQMKFKTPNIDQLAATGIRFTNTYSGCTFSAPSRSCLMTGLHTGQTSIRGNRGIQPKEEEPLSDHAFTVARLFKEAHYVTGAFGKWGENAIYP